MRGGPEERHEHHAQQQSQSQSQSFTPLQSRRLPQPAYAASLCPTMDLIVLGLGNVGGGSESQATDGGGMGLGVGANSGGGGGGAPIAVSPVASVHRTVSWQKLVAIGTSDLSSPVPDDVSGGDASAAAAAGDASLDASAGAAPRGVTSLCWSPDGRSVALGLADGGVLLHEVERTASSSSGAGGAGAAVHAIPPSPSVADFPPAASAVTTSEAGEEDASARKEETMAAAAPPPPTTPRANRSSSSSSSYTVGGSAVTTRSMSAARRRRRDMVMRRGGGRGPGESGAAPANSAVVAAGGSSAASTSLEAPPSPLRGLGWKARAVTGLTWARVGPRHERWTWTESEVGTEESWTYRSRYLDRAHFFLPPCSYNPPLSSAAALHHHHHHHPHHHSSNVVPSDEDDAESTDRASRPAARTPLTVLCVSTCAAGLHLYLHGRYRILSIGPPSLDDAPPAVNVSSDVVCTADLGTVLVSSTPPPPPQPPQGQQFAATTTSAAAEAAGTTAALLTLYSVPSLPRHRYELQQISASYCAVSAHLRTIRRGLSDAEAAWKQALKPLDVKFDNLAKLLRDYGAAPSAAAPAAGGGGPSSASASTTSASAAAVRSALRDLILSGRSSRTSSASGALDQFFSAPLMNDQLLQRLERSVETGVSSVEGTVRRTVLAPTRSLVYDAYELRGLVVSMNAAAGNSFGFDDDGGGSDYDWDGDDDDDEYDGRPATAAATAALMDVDTVQRLCLAAEELHLSVERGLISNVVEARFRIRDVMGWIRGTASQVKARGTAPDSALRENARRRRVPEGVVGRVAGFFSEEEEEGGIGGTVLPVAVPPPTSTLVWEQEVGKKKRLGGGGGWSSEGSTATATTATVVLDDDKKRGVAECVLGVPLSVSTVQSALRSTSGLATALFDQPRTALTEAVRRIDIVFPSEGECRGSDTKLHATATHKRIGGDSGGANDKVEDEQGCFAPKVVECGGDSPGPVVMRNRHWVLFARKGERRMQGKPTLRIVAIPCGGAMDKRRPGAVPSFYLSTFVVLPSDGVISDISFYGDDGSSSLAAAASEIGETVVEGRQSLGVLLERSQGHGEERVDFSGADQVSEELWLFSYDDLIFRRVAIPIESEGKIAILEMDAHDCYSFLSDESGFDEDMQHEDSGEVNLPSKRRSIRVYPKASFDSGAQGSRLVLSGSRGIGGVVTETAVSVDLFDLEEDEEDEEEEEEGGEEEDRAALETF